MNNKVLLIFFMALLLGLEAFSQKPVWSFPELAHEKLFSPIIQSDSVPQKLLSWKNSYQILPEYARENPTGYTFLCRLELKGEDKMKIPVWIKVDDNNSYSAPSFPHTYVRFKLLRF